MEKKDCEKENETKTPDFLKTAEEYLAKNVVYSFGSH